MPDFVPLPIAHKRGTLQWVTGAWLELKPKVNSMSCDLCDLHIPEAWMARPDLLLGPGLLLGAHPHRDGRARDIAHISKHFNLNYFLARFLISDCLFFKNHNEIAAL